MNDQEGKVKVGCILNNLSYDILRKNIPVPVSTLIEDFLVSVIHSIEVGMDTKAMAWVKQYYKTKLL